MKKIFLIIFGGTVAYVLLLLYIIAVTLIILGVIKCANDATCTQADFTPGIIYVVTTVGGLVSALVITKLTVTKPGENPAIIRMAETDTGKRQKIVMALVMLYLLGWMATGLASLIVGFMIFPGLNDTLSDIGTTWLGLAVAAGYAYFGIDPSK